ncbi:hypothetical protein [Vreelandella subglaciescola]|jgi:O-antigen/teichoic acid export membrane protein|uniref:Transmembrane protein n=1 Tax=Vreelandella subglaciescola TaxID=29571 RepID=A0A1M7ETQ3_9GAMM|nr:hypothetical protein [Halomonas subglaciescola]SHL95090.1 hypothetical protein SAMN05878437_0429 [Halomonas subglaciescola]
MSQRMTSPERISLGAGLCAIMLATLPRYVAGGHDTRLTLVLMAVAAIVLVMGIQWRWLPEEGKQRLPALFTRLLGLLVLGVGASFAWYGMTGSGSGWAVSLSHGATFGLLLYALTLWRR